jgi:hypothetical protein
MCSVTISTISFICINILFLNTPRTDKKIVMLFGFLKPSRMYARMHLGVRQLMSVSVFYPVESQQDEEMSHNSRQMIMLCWYKIRQIKQVRIFFKVN